MDRHHIALELDKVLELLSRHASCEDARLAALSLEPQTDLASAQALMNQTRDAHMLLARFGGPAFGGLLFYYIALFGDFNRSGREFTDCLRFSKGKESSEYLLAKLG